MNKEEDLHSDLDWSITQGVYDTVRDPEVSLVI